MRTVLRISKSDRVHIAQKRQRLIAAPYHLGDEFLYLGTQRAGVKIAGRKVWFYNLEYAAIAGDRSHPLEIVVLDTRLTRLGSLTKDQIDGLAVLAIDSSQENVSELLRWHIWYNYGKLPDKEALVWLLTVKAVQPLEQN